MREPENIISVLSNVERNTLPEAAQPHGHGSAMAIERNRKLGRQGPHTAAARAERETDLNNSRTVRFNFKLKDRNHLLPKAIRNRAYCKGFTEKSRVCNPQCCRQRPQRHRQCEKQQ